MKNDPLGEAESTPDSLLSADEGRADKFYRGRIIKLHRGGARGMLRSASGRDIPFLFAFVTVVGTHRRLEDLREGMEVGYDVSWTSHGLRVSVIQIPEQA